MGEIRTYALLDDGGLVENIILWDGNDGWTAPAGRTVALCPDRVGPGWMYQGNTWTPPEQALDE